MLRDRAVQDRLEVRSNRHCPVAADANESWKTRFRKQRFESSSSRLQSFSVTFELFRVNVQQSATKESESIAERIRGSISSRQPEQLVRECVTAGRLLGPISRLLEPVWRTGERGKRLSRVVLRRIAGAMMLRDDVARFVRKLFAFGHACNRPFKLSNISHLRTPCLRIVFRVGVPRQPLYEFSIRVLLPVRF